MALEEKQNLILTILEMFWFLKAHALVRKEVRYKLIRIKIRLFYSQLKGGGEDRLLHYIVNGRNGPDHAKTCLRGFSTC